MNKPSRRAYGLRTATCIVRLKDRNPTPIPSTFRRPDVREGAEAADRGRPAGIMGRVDDQFLDVFAWVAQVPGAGEVNAHLVFAILRHGMAQVISDLSVISRSLPCQTSPNTWLTVISRNRFGIGTKSPTGPSLKSLLTIFRPFCRFSLSAMVASSLFWLVEAGR